MFVRLTGSDVRALVIFSSCLKICRACVGTAVKLLYSSCDSLIHNCLKEDRLNGLCQGVLSVVFRGGALARITVVAAAKGLITS